MTIAALALSASTLVCGVLAASVRVDVPVYVPAAPNVDAEAPLPDPHGTRSECEDARWRALAYLDDVEDAGTDHDARRWLGQGFRAIHCAPPWPTREDPQLACLLGGCSGPVSRGLGLE